MATPPSLLEQTLARLAVRLLELGAWRDREVFPIAEAKFRAGKEWEQVRPGDSWPQKATPVWLTFDTAIPHHWAGAPVYSRFALGGEALLSVNAQVLGGLNLFHREHLITKAAQGSETLVFEAEVVPHGLFGTPVPEPRLEEACLLVPDLEVRALYEDLAAAFDAASYLHSVGRDDVSQRLADALQRAFLLIPLPRDATADYLTRLANISRDRSLQDFYGNNDSLASLWEDYSFGAPGPPLSPTAQENLPAIRKNFGAELDQIRELYPPIGTVWLTGHAHIDLAWLWPLEETRRKARRTFHNVVSLMERYSELRFNQSSAQLYAWIEQNDPLLFDKVRARVREGSWEVIGGMWVEPDGNLPAGESWVRQLLFGQRYFESRFSRRAKVAWLPDSFGFAGNLPQLLKSAGLSFFFTHKLGWNEQNPFPYDLYWWEGIDGSRVLAHSFNNRENGYNSRLTAHEVADTWHNFSAKRRHDFTLLAFGYGDGGGGPSSDMLERFARLKEFPGLPHLRMGSVTEFYENVSPESLPVWMGEQYLEYHRGTYTTQGRMKMLHRELEHALVESETAATLAFVLQQQPYPKEEFDRLWRTLLLNQFHDILPGSSIHSVYETAHVQLKNALEESTRIRGGALAAGKIREDSRARRNLQGSIWNLQIYDRPLVAEIATDLNSEVQLLTSDGSEVLTQRLDENRILAVAENIVVPALGMISVVMAEGASVTVSSPVRINLDGMENEYLRIRLRADGTLDSIYDKECGREILAGRGNQLWLFTDIPRQFDAWDIDSSYVGEGEELLAGSAPELVENGPLRAALRVTRRRDATEIVQTYRLRRLSRILEIHSRVRWCGRRKLLRALIPLKIRAHEMWAETVFGAVARSNSRNTPWDRAKFEVPAHRWVDLSESSYGVSLLNNGKYGHSADGNLLGISLLRSPIYPDPLADEGDHEFVYAIYPHRGSWRTGTVRAAQELHSPLRYSAGGPSAPHASLFRLRGDLLELSCLKRAEDSDDVLVRLYEPNGDRGQSILESALRLERASIVNILEEQLEELQIEDGRHLTVLFTPFQVISLKLTFSQIL